MSGKRHLGNGTSTSVSGVPNAKWCWIRWVTCTRSLLRSGRQKTALPWHVRPTAATWAVQPTWICPRNPEHRWQASPASRVRGSTRPDCQEVGKSKVELAHMNRAQNVFGNAFSGHRMSSEHFSRGGAWTVISSLTATLANAWRSSMTERSGMRTRTSSIARRASICWQRALRSFACAKTL